MLLLTAFLLLGRTLTQRPSATSVCDYYAQSLYGISDPNSQSLFIQAITSLAFAGGSGLPNTTGITGILNPGMFNNVPVDLTIYFNGTGRG